jgi:uncharacterized DUF497 family protein
MGTRLPGCGGSRYTRMSLSQRLGTRSSIGLTLICTNVHAYRMETTIVSGFDWDEGNRAKCRKHGISIEEIEELFSRTVMILPDEAHSTTEKRFKAIGQTTAGRHIFLVFTLREHDGKSYIRPISTRYMHQKEIDHYEKENPDL